MFKSLFHKDTFAIFKNKKLIIAMTAILFIPVLYAGMFLWAFWDPYAYLEDVPVAVVNEDEGYEFNGEMLQIGDELIDKLREEAAFNFHFVDKKEGYVGLNHQEYYILIEIPKDFSENATTVLDDPQKLELLYVPNESFNFLAAQMGETAMLQIQQALQEEITKTYAETVLERVDDVKDMLGDAADATVQLDDGAHELFGGAELISTNLVTLSDKLDDFGDGVQTATKGVGQLNDGSSTLADGINELFVNSVKLRDASVDIQDGARALHDGMRAANEGVTQLEDNLPTLIEGTNELSNGLTMFHEQLPVEVSSKLTSAVLENKDPLRKKVNETIIAKKAELSPLISTRLAHEISAGAADAIVTEANALIDDAAERIASQVAADISALIENKTNEHIETIKAEITEILTKVDVPEGTIETVLEKIDLLHPNVDVMESVIYENIYTVLDQALTDVVITAEQQVQLEQFIYERAEEKVAAGVDEALDGATDVIDDTLDSYEEKLLSNLDNLANELEKEMSAALDEPIGQLQDGVTQINDGQKQLYAGVKALHDGTNELTEGTTALQTGQTSYVQNMFAFTDSFVLANDGAMELADGISELQSGMGELQDATNQIQDGVGQLADGSVELHDGVGELVDGTGEFRSEMTDAKETADDLSISDRAKDMIAKPVDVENEKINEVPNYGTGFAPYFLSLGLFVGALLLSIVYPLRDTSSVPSSGTEWFLRKFVVLFGVGVLQAAIACFILLVGLKIDVQSIPLFLLFAIITSLTFITLIQFFVTVLDDPGRFIAIIILIMQLTTSAGTFPLELIPKVLQPFNLFLPMTYSVSGFKAVISSGDFGAMWTNVGILFVFIALFVAGTWTYFVLKYKKTYQTKKDTIKAL